MKFRTRSSSIRPVRPIRLTLTTTNIIIKTERYHFAVLVCLSHSHCRLRSNTWNAHGNVSSCCRCHSLNGMRQKKKHIQSQIQHKVERIASKLESFRRSYFSHFEFSGTHPFFGNSCAKVCLANGGLFVNTRAVNLIKMPSE